MESVNVSHRQPGQGLGVYKYEHSFLQYDYINCQVKRK